MFKRTDRIELFDHYCKHLGSVKKNWNLKDVPKEDLRILGFFNPSPVEQVTLCTFGISDYALGDAAHENPLRIEYAISIRNNGDINKVASLLLAISEHAIKHRKFPGRHGVLEGEGSVLYGGNPVFEHFYLTDPITAPKELAICPNVAPQIEIIQLVPISTSEKNFIKVRGWENFENLLRDQQEDLLAFDERSRFA